MDNASSDTMEQLETLSQQHSRLDESCMVLSTHHKVPLYTVILVVNIKCLEIEKEPFQKSIEKYKTQV